MPAFTNNVRVLFVSAIVTLQLQAAVKESSSQSVITSPILQHPKSVTVTVGEVAKFSFSAQAEFINWLIDGRTLHDSDGYVNESTIVQNQTANIRLSTLCIRGLATNNGSNVTCFAQFDEMGHMSNNAAHYVQVTHTSASPSTIQSTTSSTPAIPVRTTKSTFHPQTVCLQEI